MTVNDIVTYTRIYLPNEVKYVVTVCSLNSPRGSGTAILHALVPDVL
jgi:hypothetical protein